ncbi:hypothetical protein [Catenovulum agarivorans]|uniref:hypothetical protein n=1 Tax=Catenovulum agarivorans TaxID=1172192 RepID=UPI00037E8B8A|nr:hypothetical protein [Catenovulum agarivorans]
MPIENNSNVLKGIEKLAYSSFILIYILSYSVLSIWLLFDGWINKFSSIHWLWGIESSDGFSNGVLLTIFSLLGAILGGAILSITSFHKYIAIEKKFDRDHLWGFIFIPILSVIVGIIVFTLVQSGLLVLSGSFADGEQSITTTMGFTAIGCISGYNWDVIAAKLQELSKNIFKKDE